MIRFRLVTSIIGYLAMGFVYFMYIPLVISLIKQEPKSTLAFLITIAICFVFGRFAMYSEKKAEIDDLNRMESLAVVVFGWLTLAIFGAIPYLFFNLSWVDSLFESMSGFTTTGSTILSDFNQLNSSMFFYRGFTQWIGGLGILVIFVALLPQLAIAGRQLFFAEVSAESKEKLSPRIKDTAYQLLVWYTFLTFLCTIALCLAGMNPLEALTNSSATIAAAGFSPKDGSIWAYHNPTYEWVLIIFMFLAGANFVLQVKTVKGIIGAFDNKDKAKKQSKDLKESKINYLKGFFFNPELLTYTGIILVAAFIIVVVLYYHMPYGTALGTIIRDSLFQCISIITSTGFASLDYECWPMAAKSILVILMFIGGCSGSAGGGLKVIRVLILWKYLKKILLKNIYPEAVTRIKLGNRTLRDSDIQPILSFFLFYLFVFFVCGTIICAVENSMIEGYSGSIALLGNIGPGFSRVDPTYGYEGAALNSIGPMGNFANWHDVSKLVAIFLMWAGRLEVVALLVFLHPEVWRGSRW